MKKVLLASAALLVAGMVSANAAPVKLSVGGYANWYTGFVDGNNAYNDAMTYSEEMGYPVPAVKEYNHVPVLGDVEVAFKGETVLQNGVKIGAVIELEGVTGGYDDINEDQSYVYVDTAYGRFVAGKMDTLSKQFHTASKDVGLLGIQDSDVDMFNNMVGGMSTDIRSMDNATTLAYISPKFAGFTVAAQYSAMGGVLEGGTYMDATHNNAGDSAAYAATVAYDNTFGSVKVAADASYAVYDNSFMYEGYKYGIDYDVSAGARVSVAGFTFGAGYKYTNGEGSVGDINTFDVGVAYENGPYGVSVAYIHEDRDSATAFSDGEKRDLVLASVSYNVTEGVDTFASVAYAKYDVGASEDALSEKAESYVFATGIGLTF